VIDLAAFGSDADVKSCWKYKMFVLGSGLPSNDQNAITFDIDAKTATVYSTKASSAGSYHIRIEAVDNQTGDDKKAHQIEITFKAPAGPLPEPDGGDENPTPTPTPDDHDGEGTEIGNQPNPPNWDERRVIIIEPSDGAESC